MIRVLIVEDDPMVTEINQHYLGLVRGFTCVQAVPGVAEALSFLRRNTVDLVLLDIFMPGKNGLELLAEIRRQQTGVDVIVISAASDMQNIKKALRLGAVDYLIKPFEFERFHAALCMYQKGHELMKQEKKLSQEELDRLFLHQGQVVTESPELPKGLTDATLRRTVDQISSMESHWFSTEELAEKVGISRVSMRKYINFLVELGFILSDLNYQTVGRPVYKYSLNEKYANAVIPYLKGNTNN